MCDHRAGLHRCVGRAWYNPSGSAGVTCLHAAPRTRRAERAVQGDVWSVWRVLQGTPSAPLISAQRVARFDDYCTSNVFINNKLRQRYSRFQVKQQKASRGQGADTPTVERETKRVHTEVWLVEQPTGGFTYLTAGVDAMGQEGGAGIERGRGEFQQDYAGRAGPLPGVPVTEGARTVTRPVAELFGQPVPVILDWYPLDKKVEELMGMVARNKQEKAVHVAHLLHHLWHGRTDAALTYLRREVQAKNPEQLAALVTYLEKHQAEII